ncbi:MAG: hypothetical protein K8R90_01005 [Candidatus Cloacimonetes bacterium]|nr:hypothetical protein [Candidatus Cloacimonadota bacterium]
MRKLLLLCVLAALSVGLPANSIFSIEGMPERYYSYDVYGIGAGDTGWADLFRLNLGHGNPALAVTSNTVNFSAAATFGYMTYEDRDGNSFRDDGITFPYASFTIPMRALRFGLHFSTISAGNVTNERLRNFDLDDETTVEVNEENRIQSSIYRTDFLVALKNRFCHVGVAVNGYIGQRVHNVKQDFTDAGYMDTQYEVACFYQGLGVTVGLARRFGDVAASLSWASGANLDGDEEFTSIFNTEKLGAAEYELPMHLGFGLAWRMQETLKATFDLHYEMWEDTTTYTDGVNTWKVGLGLSYDPLWGYGSWYERIPLRLGVGHRLLPFKANDSEVKETLLSLGISAPLRNPGDQIQFSVQYIMRGDKQNNGVEDNCLLFSIGATGFDIFKVRTKRTAPREIPKPDGY